MEYSKVGRIYALFDSTFNLISKVIFSAIKRLSPYATAVLPGTLFGYTIYAFFMEFTGQNLVVSLLTGISAFIVLESAGIWSGHKIAEYLGERKVWIPIATFVAYFVIGVATLWLLDDEIDQNIKLVGTGLFALSAVVYTLFGLQSYQEKMEMKEKREHREEVTEEIQKENRDFEREQAALDRETERKVRLKLANAEAKVLASGQVQQPVQAVAPESFKGKPAVRYDKQKMTALKVALKRNQNATKTELASAIGVSRPTLDRYISILEEERRSE
jgi:hypothetical protein